VNKRERSCLSVAFSQCDGLELTAISRVTRQIAVIVVCEAYVSELRLLGIEWLCQWLRTSHSTWVDGCCGNTARCTVRVSVIRRPRRKLPPNCCELYNI